ncbi:uncharacterized protein LOC108808094 [Raphanus sativus]|uniref:Uncharacterized protein LOC108808094 n=1 Tax=Raphanus sativus TaxID=3726 RepID=A0A9W3BUM7_RAPSA|nr:uncharacterized protein LOC108808094 [Raphanus sativus]
MASLNKPGPLNGAEYESIRELWGVPYEAVIDYPNGDTPENVRPGYCGAFMSHFRDGFMSLPIPSFLLEILAELGLAFTQITLTFWRYVLTTFVRGREEGLEFGRSVISGIPNKDVNWTDKFFVFKIDPVTVGDFDFSRIPMKWNENVELFGSSSLTPELRVLIAALRRGECHWSSFNSERIRAAYALPPGLNHGVPIPLAEPIRPRRDQKGKGVKRVEPPAEPSDANSDSVPLKRARGTLERRVLRSSSQAQSPVVLATPVSVVRLVRSDQPESRVPGETDAGGEIASKVQRRRLILGEETSGDPSASSSEPSKQDPGEGTSRLRPINLLSDYRSGSPMTFSYDVDAPILENPEQLASIWRKLRNPSCELPPLEHMRGRDAYVQMAVANDKAMEDNNEYAALMKERLSSEQQRAKEVEDLKVLLTASAAEKVTLEGDLESLKTKFKREAELREKRLEGRGELLARETIRRRKAESAAEIRLQEVRAKIEALTEYGEGDFDLEEELDRLKSLETSVEIDYGLPVVSDDSLRGLDLPQVSGDLVNQGG